MAVDGDAAWPARLSHPWAPVGAVACGSLVGIVLFAGMFKVGLVSLTSLQLVLDPVDAAAGWTAPPARPYYGHHTNTGAPVNFLERSVGPPPLEAAAGAAKSYLYVPAPNRANPYAKSLAPPKTPFNDPVPKPDWQGTFNNIVRRQHNWEDAFDGVDSDGHAVKPVFDPETMSDRTTAGFVISSSHDAVKLPSSFGFVNDDEYP